MFRNANGASSMVDTVLRLRPDIVVFAAGAHFEDIDDLYTMWSTLTTLIKTIIMKQLPHIKLIWKSTNPADDNCMSIVEPLPTRVDDDNNIPIPTSSNHHLFRRFDTISKEFARELGMNYIDMTPLYMRGDAHVGYYINEQGILSMSHCYTHLSICIYLSIYRLRYTHILFTLMISSRIHLLFILIQGNPISDCLHYVVPGPLNLFSTLLLQMMFTGEI